MAHLNSSIKTNEILRLTPSGIQMSSYYDIMKSIESLFKDIYGSDIDISEGTADRQYIMQLALILFNICQSEYMLSINANTSSASEKYLDILYNLQNAKRKSATKSYCYCFVKYVGNESSTEADKINENGVDYQYISFFDISGNKWKWKERINNEPSSNKTIFLKDKLMLLKFECENEGPISLYADNISYDSTGNPELTDDNHGNIDYFETTNKELKVWIKSNATLGTIKESNSDFRRRKSYSDTSNKQNVLDTVLYSLENLEGIEDVKMYANPDGTENVKSDGNITIGQRNILVVIRRSENYFVGDDIIAKTIYNKILPGITTINSDDSSDNLAKSYGIEIYSGLKETIKWQEAKISNPTNISLKFIFNEDIYNKEKMEELILRTIIEYTYKVKFIETLRIIDLISKLNEVSEIVNQENSYTFYEGNFGTNIIEFKNKDSYIHLNEEIFKFNYTGSTCTLTYKGSGE